MNFWTILVYFLVFHERGLTKMVIVLKKIFHTLKYNNDKEL